MNKAEVKKLALDGLLLRNPALAAALGLSAVLGASAALKTGLALGVITTLVLVLSNAAVSLLRRWTPRRLALLTRLIITATFTGAAELVMAAALPDLRYSLGIFLPLTAVNGLLLSSTQAAAGERVGPAALGGLFSGLGYTAAMGLLALLRELLGSGSVWGVPLLGEGAVLLAAPCGGFLLLGALAAAVQYAKGRMARPKAGKEAPEKGGEAP